MRDTVSMAFEEATYDSILRWNAWVVEPTGKWKWFQKKAWQFLNSRGAVKPYHEQMVSYTRVDLNPDKILETVMRAREHLFNIGKRPTQVLIGAEDVSQLMSDPSIMQMSSPVTLSGEAGYGREIYGLPLTIIPHMKGCLVL